MTITKNQNGAVLEISLEGRLDTETAPALEEELIGKLGGVEELIIDLNDLEYISSAGLRVLIRAYNELHNKGKIKLINANEIVTEVFNVTGLTDILSIE